MLDENGPNHGNVSSFIIKKSIEWKQMFLFLFATSARFARNTMTYLGLFLRQCGLFTKLPDAVGPNFK
jgi:hypothetical protein